MTTSVEALGLAAVGLDPHLVGEALDPAHRRGRRTRSRQGAVIAST